MDTTLGDPMVARLLDGRYRVEALIARGGMASVYLATDTRLERRVAVKVMHPHLAEDPDTAARFEQEARAAARLSHPDLVAVYDQGSDHGNAFLVMEYVPGATLRDVLRDRGRLSPGETLAVMDHVLAALATAHRQGLVHRDVKPENVLLTADGRVKVADFGLARAASTASGASSTALIGTAAYLSPEQVEHGRADARSDVYSAGILTYELLTGQPPFHATSTYALLQQHVTDDVPPPSTRAAGIPPDLDDLVMTAADRDPDRRPRDAGQLHHELVATRDRLGLHEGVPALPAAVTATLDRPEHDGAHGVAATATMTPAAAAAVPTTVFGSHPPAGPFDDHEDAPPRRRRRRAPWIVALLVLLVAAAAVAGWWFAVGRYTTTPGVKGSTQTAAVSSLHRHGLHARFLADGHSPTVPVGLVMSESPAPGTRVRHHATITLQLSSGPVTHTMPRLTGDSLTSAESTLTGLHLTVASVVHDYSTTVARDKVVSTTPDAGQVVDEGSSVTVVVSRGPQPMPIPKVVGLTQAQAQKALTTAGFTATIQQSYSSSIASGTVISSSPDAGTSTPVGSAVTLNVSKGPHLYPVPSVVGDSIAHAIRVIEAAGFVANPQQIVPLGPGRVVHVTPSGNQPHGATITLEYF